MSKKTKIDVSIIIVSYNCRDFLIDCLHSVKEDINSCKLKIEVIVVDNSSNEETAEELKKSKYDWLKWMRTENRGWGAANNVGLKEARGKYLFLLNPDTVVQKGVARYLYDYLEKHEEYGVVGPRLIFGDGNLQISGYDNFPGLLSAFLENTLLDRLLYWLLPDIIYPGKLFSRRLHDKKREVAHVIGAAMFMRREIYDQIGGFDERFFMFREETDWQYRMNLAGWKIVFNPGVTVTHFEGGSTGQVRFKKNWSRKLDMYLPSVYGYQYKWGNWFSSWILISIYFFGSIFTLLILLPVLIINNLFCWVVPKFWRKVNVSIYDIAIYHWALIVWHIKRWFTGKSVFEDIRGVIVPDYKK